VKRLKKLILWAIAGFIIFSLAGFFVAPPVVKGYLVKRLSEYFHRQVSIGSISVNPYKFTVTVRGITVRERGSTDVFASFDEIRCAVASISPFERAFVFKEMRITKPYLKIDRRTDLSYNFSDIVKSEETGERVRVVPVRFSVGALKILDGSIDFWDGPEETKHTIRELSVSLPFISNLPRYVGTSIEPRLSMNVNGTPYTIEGKVKPFTDSLETLFNIRFENLDIPYYLSYVPGKMIFQVPSGYVDGNLQLSFMQFKDKSPTLTLGGSVVVRDLALKEGKDPLLRLPLMEVSLASAELFSGVFQVEKILLKSPELFVRRNEKGVLNLTTLFMPEENKGKGPADAAATPAAASGMGTAAGSSAAPFSALVTSLEVAGGKVTFVDKKPEEPVTLVVEDIALAGKGLSTAKDAKASFDFACKVNKKGSLALSGETVMEPMDLRAAVDVRNLEIIPFQPYFAHMVNMDVTGGAVSAKGDLHLADSGRQGLTGRFNGTASISRFSSIDQVDADDFLIWESLYVGGVDIGYNPTGITIKEVALSNFFASVIIGPEGTVNLQDILKTGKGPAPGAVPPKDAAPGGTVAPEAPQIPIKIETMTLQGGTIDFEDRSVTPEVGAKLEKIGGRISGLSAAANTVADVDLRGVVDTYAPLVITGKINPLREELFVDLKARVQGVELTPATPYAGKYLGYTLAKGKLSMNATYVINKRKLDSTNDIFLDQLTLGEKVESPDATKLPVRLAIALLKDRNGQIKLDIPVSGSLDDPQFSVWTIVWKILGNLLVKAATSPFALLGSLFGGGEELGSVAFDYGSDILSEAAGKKVTTLAKILGERPALTLDIEGYVDLEKDKEALRQGQFERKLKAQKLRDLVKAGSGGVSVDEVKILPEEYTKYLALAYKAEKFPKPRNIIGLEKSLPPPEMEKLMLGHIEIKQGDLRALASARAGRVKDAILTSGDVEPRRVFVTEPKSLVPEKKEGFSDSRVDFKLK
jgi:hypothetical protein